MTTPSLPRSQILGSSKDPQPVILEDAARRSSRTFADRAVPCLSPKAA